MKLQTLKVKTDSKLAQTNTAQVDARGGKASNTARLRSSRQVLAQIRKGKDAIFAESRPTLQAHERMLHLALNEAEALAFQTEYPHLVFPALAAEKVHAIAAWKRHQRAVREKEAQLVLAE